MTCGNRPRARLARWTLVTCGNRPRARLAWWTLVTCGNRPRARLARWTLVTCRQARPLVTCRRARLARWTLMTCGNRHVWLHVNSPALQVRRNCAFAAHLTRTKRCQCVSRTNPLFRSCSLFGVRPTYFEAAWKHVDMILLSTTQIVVTLCLRLVSDRRQTHQVTEACPHRAPCKSAAPAPSPHTCGESTQLAIHTHPIDNVRGPFHKVTSCNWLRMGKSVEKPTNPSKLAKQVCEAPFEQPGVPGAPRLPFLPQT